MKPGFRFIIIIVILFSCNGVDKKQDSKTSSFSIEGTWKLVSGTTISKNDTTFTDYTKNQEMIKIINATHFAFLRHDLHNGKDSAAVYESGGGHYTLTNDQYTEHLQYCNAREWEGHDFQFTVSIKNDTLIQQGIEKVEGAGVDRVIIEKYAKVTN
ncbi:MAG: hypothetical protein JWM28_751 [Chitinophagaceae bacterium]|nr:hypothetical protein [Chitinophagaceae bacterium]